VRPDGGAFGGDITGSASWKNRCVTTSLVLDRRTVDGA
jgi:hypothetical protein